jgi:hypothetical protein
MSEIVAIDPTQPVAASDLVGDELLRLHGSTFRVVSTELLEDRQGAYVLIWTRRIRARVEHPRLIPIVRRTADPLARLPR